MSENGIDVLTSWSEPGVGMKGAIAEARRMEKEMRRRGAQMRAADKDEHGYGSYPKGERGDSKDGASDLYDPETNTVSPWLARDPFPAL